MRLINNYKVKKGPYSIFIYKEGPCMNLGSVSRCFFVRESFIIWTQMYM